MGLDFLHPGLLAGLLLAALPLLIHLISRRKATTVRFAALEFVLRSTRRRARRIRLRQLLLLLVRTALIVALVLAVAGPRLVARDRPAAPGAPSQVIFCLDGSASMQARPEDAGKSLFELARARIAQRLRRLDPAVPAALLLAHHEIVPLVEPASFDRQALLRALEQAQVSARHSDLGRCLTRAQAMPSPEGQPGRSGLVVVSDGAAHAWAAGPLAAGALELELVRVPADDAPRLDNRAITELRAAPSEVAAAEAYDVHFSLRRSSGAQNSAAIDVEITLQVDERPVSRVNVALGPDGAASKRFMQVPIDKPPGSEVTLAVFAADDGFGLDDHAQLPLELPRLVRALVIDGDPQTVRHRDEVFYLERALGAESGVQARVSSRTVNVDSVLAPDVASADVVVLANVASLSSEVARAVVSRVRSGGGLLVTAGDKLDPAFYNGALADLLPSPVRGAKSSAPLDEPEARELLTLEVVSPDHPLFAHRGASAASGLSRVRTHTLLLIDPGRPKARTDLLRFSNGAPALVEHRVDSGRVLLLCTSVDRDWTDLPIRPGFLPLMQQAVLYLADAIQAPRPRRFVVGDAVALRAPSGARHLIVSTPDEEELRLPVSDGEAPVFEATGQVGLYQVAADLGADQPRLLPEERFAVSIDPRESDTALLDLEALRARLPAGVDLAEGDGGPRRERPLWPFLLAGLALLALAEATVARR